MSPNQLPPSIIRAHNLGWKPKCGLCGQAMRPKENFLALFGNDDSTCPAFYIGRSPFIWSTIRYVQPLRCGNMGCRMCGAEGVAIHADCYDVFMLNCESERARGRIWVASAWRDPWRRAPELYLDDGSFTSPRPSTAESIGIPELAKLPMEIIQHIRSYSLEAPYWRYCTVQDVAQRSTAPTAFQSFPLHEVSAWERGGEPLLAADTSQLPIVRVLVDSHGISKLERLPDWPEHVASPSDTRRVYVFIDERRVKDISMHFMFGHARIVEIRRGEGLQIWDTPAPPRQGLKKISTGYELSGPIPDAILLRTIELSQVTGLTIFYALGSVMSIHAHTAKAPLATKTYERFSGFTKRVVVGAYVPLAPNDRILNLGIRGCKYSLAQCSFLIRTKLVGDILVGAYHGKHTLDYTFGGSPPTTLVFSPKELDEDVAWGITGPNVFGAKLDFTSDKPHTRLPKRKLRGEPRSIAPPIYSSASLEDVDEIHIFKSAKTGFCRGLLIKYKNGGERAVGECRIGVDPVTTCAKPSRICTSRHILTTCGHTGRKTEASEVRCTRGDDHHHKGEEGWECFSMEGHVVIWFDHQTSQLDVFRPK